MEDIAVDVAAKQRHGQQAGPKHGPDHIGTSLCTPVRYAVLTAEATAMRPRHVVSHPGKPTFIQIHNKPACGFMRRDYFSEGCKPDGIRLGMT